MGKNVAYSNLAIEMFQTFPAYHLSTCILPHYSGKTQSDSLCKSVKINEIGNENRTL